MKVRNEVNSMVRADTEMHKNRILGGFILVNHPKRFYGYMRKLQTVKDVVAALKKERRTKKWLMFTKYDKIGILQWTEDQHSRLQTIDNE